MKKKEQPAACTFCRIIMKDMGSEVVEEKDSYIAIKDINPKAPVHILFISKGHISSLNELEAKDVDFIDEMMLAIPRVAETYQIKESGYRVVTNVGKDGGQEMEHLHFHLMGGEKLGGMV